MHVKEVAALLLHVAYLATIIGMLGSEQMLHGLSRLNLHQ